MEHHIGGRSFSGVFEDVVGSTGGMHITLPPINTSTRPIPPSTKGARPQPGIGLNDPTTLAKTMLAHVQKLGVKDQSVTCAPLTGRGPRIFNCDIKIESVSSMVAEVEQVSADDKSYTPLSSG